MSLDGEIHTSIVIHVANTKVAHIKRLTIPCLELCGAVIVTRLLIYISQVLGSDDVRAPTDGTVMLSRLQGNRCHFKPFVGNQSSEILSLMLSNCWQHVPSNDNPADSTSGGLCPSDLINHCLWWDGPSWLRDNEPNWPKMLQLDDVVGHCKKNSLTSASESDQCSTLGLNVQLQPP